MIVFYSDSKTDLKLWCDYCIKFQLIEGLQMFLVDWQLCVACYYHTTPTDYPSTIRGMSVGPPVVVNIDFCGYLKFFSIGFVWFIWVQYTTDNLSGQLLGSLHRPVLIFQPLVNCRASDKQRWAVSETAYPLRELCSLYVSAYKSVFLGGFRRWRESILATQRNLDLHGSCCLPKYQTGVKNIPPKFYTLFVMSL